MSALEIQIDWGTGDEITQLKWESMHLLYQVSALLCHFSLIFSFMSLFPFGANPVPVKGKGSMRIFVDGL